MVVRKGGNGDGKRGCDEKVWRPRRLILHVDYLSFYHISAVRGYVKSCKHFPLEHFADCLRFFPCFYVGWGWHRLRFLGFELWKSLEYDARNRLVIISLPALLRMLDGPLSFFGIYAVIAS